MCKIIFSNFKLNSEEIKNVYVIWKQTFVDKYFSKNLKIAVKTERKRVLKIVTILKERTF
jgi:hypothetical protein